MPYRSANDSGSRGRSRTSRESISTTDYAGCLDHSANLLRYRLPLRVSGSFTRPPLAEAGSPWSWTPPVPQPCGATAILAEEERIELSGPFRLACFPSKYGSPVSVALPSLAEAGGLEPPTVLPVTCFRDRTLDHPGCFHLGGELGTRTPNGYYTATPFPGVLLIQPDALRMYGGAVRNRTSQHFRQLIYSQPDVPASHFPPHESPAAPTRTPCGARGFDASRASSTRGRTRTANLRVLNQTPLPNWATRAQSRRGRREPPSPAR